MTIAALSPENGWKITGENFEYKILQFRERQAGIGLVFDPESKSYNYNAYCIETKLLTELFSSEYEFLDDALEVVNNEFGTWEIVDLSAKSGCGSCAAKGQ